MVDVPDKSDARKKTDAIEERQADVLQRLQDARGEKSSIENDLQNCYFYSAPRRVRRQGSEGAAPTTKPGDDRQLQTSFGFEVVDDFMSMVIETFMPREGPWAERGLPKMFDENGEEVEEITAINKRIAAEDEKVFDLIRSSNFYAAVAQTGVPDGAMGISALLITDPGRGQPIICRGATIRELEFDLGPDGRLDFRAIVRNRNYRYLKAELGKEIAALLPDEEAKKVKDSPNTSVEIVWSWYRNWDNFGDFEWRHCVLVNQKLIYETSMLGEGSVALALGRFGATPDFAWPDGPLVKSLADMVQLDEVRGALVENVDFTLRPPIAYEDDGVLNLPVDGIRPGEAYPKRPSFGKPAFETIYEPRPIEAAMFDVQSLEQRIKRLHYVDTYEQKGKTPPTATQWIDELVIRQKRIGTPGYAYWREFPYEVFQRFRYLGEKRGSVRPLEQLGVPANAALQPYNPAERAQDSQDISTAMRFAELGQMIAPTMWPVVVDELPTLKNLKAKFRDKIISFRDDAEIDRRIQTLASLGANLVGGGQGGPQGGQGGAPPA